MKFLLVIDASNMIILITPFICEQEETRYVKVLQA